MTVHRHGIAPGLLIAFSLFGWIACGEEAVPPVANDPTALLTEPESRPVPTAPEVKPARLSCEERAVAFLDFSLPHVPNRLIMSPPGSVVERSAAFARPDVFGDPAKIEVDREGARTRAFRDELISAIKDAQIIPIENVAEFAGTDALTVDLSAGDTSDRGRIRELATKLVCNDQAGTVELAWIVGAHAVPTDPGYGDDQWSLEKVSLPTVWDTQTGSATVTVAVIDSGIDHRHEDLTPTIDGTTILDQIDMDTQPEDGPRGHGTRVAGIIGAVTNNSKGIAGISWAISLLPVRVFSKSHSPDTDKMAQAIDLAIAQGADIVNASWGFRAQGSPAFRTAVCTSGAGVLFVASSGHGGFDLAVHPVYPAAWAQDADCTNVISVAASNKNDRLAGSSNWSPTHVDVAAPGKKIPAPTWCRDRDLEDTDNDGTGDICRLYRDLSGTSASVPHVTGVAALLKAQRPMLTPQQAKQAIVAGADEVITLRGLVKEGRRLNAAGAFVNLP